MLDLTAVKAASEVASGQELAPLLENFHFFAPLREHLQEIAGLDGGLAGQLHNLYALTDHFPQQLCGDEIHSDTPMVIISEAPASLYLDLVLPHDPPPPNAWEVPAEGQRTHGTVRFVVLGRNLTYKGSPLVRIQR